MIRNIFWFLGLVEPFRLPQMKKLFLVIKMNVIRFLLFLIFWIALSHSRIARAEDDALYMIGLEVHASRSVTPGEAEKISRYLFHNITKWSPGAAMIVYEGDTRVGVRKSISTS